MYVNMQSRSFVLKQKQNLEQKEQRKNKKNARVNSHKKQLPSFVNVLFFTTRVFHVFFFVFIIIIVKKIKKGLRKRE